MSINATVDETTYEGIDTIQTGGKTITLEEVGGTEDGEGFKYHVVKIQQNDSNVVLTPMPTGYIYLRCDSDEPITDVGTLKSKIIEKQGYGDGNFPDNTSLSLSSIARGEFWIGGRSGNGYKSMLCAYVLYNTLYIMFQDDVSNGYVWNNAGNLLILEDNIVTLPIEI